MWKMGGSCLENVTRTCESPTNELVYKLTELKATNAAKEGKNNHHLGVSTFTHLDLYTNKAKHQKK